MARSGRIGRVRHCEERTGQDRHGRKGGDRTAMAWNVWIGRLGVARPGGVKKDSNGVARQDR